MIPNIAVPAAQQQSASLQCSPITDSTATLKPTAFIHAEFVLICQRLSSQGTQEFENLKSAEGKSRINMS
jgi:hypothetical protein